MNKFSFDAVIFDLDGVITKTALVHASAWKSMFDEFLRGWEKKHGKPFLEFSHTNDYLPYVDGKPRYKGVESFLKARGITIPYGSPDDNPSAETICGLGNRKNEVFNKILESEGVEVYDSTVALMNELKKAGIKLGVASSSQNCKQVLERANLLHFFETRVDGEVSAQLGLHGKPEPDIFTVACDNLGVDYFRAVVVEDAVSGVQAGRKGNFGFVLGIAREDNALELKMNGADVVIADLEELNGIEGIEKWFDSGLCNDLWSISHFGYDTTKERSREALLTIGNGFFGTRGALEESHIEPTNYPATYMAGVYNRVKSKVGDKEIENEDIVNTINWLPITFKVAEGDWFDPNKDEVLELDRTLNFRNGVLIKKMLVRDSDGRETLVKARRFVSMDNQHHAAIDYSLTPLNYSGYLRIKSSLRVPPHNDGVERYKHFNQKQLTPTSQGAKENISFIAAKTTQSGIEVAAAAKLEVFYQGKPLATNFRIKEEPGWINSYIKAMVKEGETLRIEKMVSLSHSLCPSTPNPTDFVQTDIKQLKSFGHIHAASIKVWEKHWEKADIRITGDRLAQKLLRMHIYHTLVTTSEFNAKIDSGIPPRGLHGEGHRGHIFWDEIFILPFFKIHFPEVAKSILLYRYKRLDKARENAKENGFKGAMFPWQSGSDGRDETQKQQHNPVTGEWSDDYSSLQQHVSIAIAINIWNYYQTTGDLEFIEKYGAELFLEICHFWESKTSLNEKTGGIEINGVMGPDEFHEKLPNSQTGGLKNNAYTNIMVVWLFKRALDIVKALSEKSKLSVLKKTNLSESAIQKWNELAKRLTISVSNEGIIEQFEGYFGLKELDWDKYRSMHSNISRIDRILKAQGKSANDYKVSKQADLLMIFFSIVPKEVIEIINGLGYSLPNDFLEKNFDYYLNRCSHGTPLSQIVHAYIASLVGRKEQSLKLYRDALCSDYSETNGGATAEGINLGVMTGTVIMAIKAFAGISFKEGILCINPCLPKEWKDLTFGLKHKGVDYQFIITNKIVAVKTGKNNAAVIVKGKEHILKANEVSRISI
jgi:beta-phosphoglucomutase family hydrolase